MNDPTFKTELAQLAHLLRTCANAAKSIAWSLPPHAEELLSVATNADRMASLVESIQR